MTVAIAIGLLTARPAMAQRTPGQPGTAAATVPTTMPSNALKPEELEAVASPIALYPDSVLAQVLMASTYPLEVVQADRWIKDEKNKKLKDDALAKALNGLDWDASVKSLIQFPQVLDMMSKQLDWTVKLGDAFIADQAAVMDAIQRLRAKAQKEGNLKSSKEQNVTVEVNPATTQQVIVQSDAPPPPPQIIKIESASPSVIYVPTYNPSVVYGAWAYPYYPPPAPYYPPGYVAGTALLSFGIGVACGAAWGHAWGGCHWGHSEVDIDVDRNVNFNSNIDREAARNAQQNRQTNRQGNQDARQGDRSARQGDRQTGRDSRQAGRAGSGGASSFQHDPSHRKGVSYRDQGTADRFGASSSRDAAQARESFRGRSETGRQDISRGSANQFQRDLASGRSGQYGAGGRTEAGRSTAGAANRSSYGGSGRSYSGGGSSYGGSRSSSSSAFDGAGRSSGSSTRNYSSRGSSSRSSYSSGSRSSSGGGSRGFSGGGSRGGGGGGGGRGGGRR